MTMNTGTDTGTLIIVILLWNLAGLVELMEWVTGYRITLHQVAFRLLPLTCWQHSQYQSVTHLTSSTIRSRLAWGIGPKGLGFYVQCEYRSADGGEFFLPSTWTRLGFRYFGTKALRAYRDLKFVNKAIG